MTEFIAQEQEQSGSRRLVDIGKVHYREKMLALALAVCGDGNTKAAINGGQVDVDTRADDVIRIADKFLRFVAGD